MRVFAWVVGGLLFLIVLLFGTQYIASERVEVIEVHIPDANGEVVTTRLWVVDHQDGMYIRVGANGSGWYARLQAHPDIEVTRRGQRSSYEATPEPEKSLVINQLMYDKYTWGDSVIAFMFGSREGSIPILLKTSPD